MKVILLQNVKKVGQKGEVKEVSEGFAHNHLFPRKLAKPGTVQNLNEVAKLSQDKNKHKQNVLGKIQENFNAVHNQTFCFKLKSNEQGALFAKFEEKHLIEELHKKGFKNIESKHISIQGSPIKHTGEYSVTLKEDKLIATCAVSIQPL